MAWVLAVCAIVAVSIYEFAPQVLFSGRAQVGVPQDVAEAPAAAPAVTEEEPSDSDADSDSDAPAKKRPLTGARAASQGKQGTRATR